MRILVTGGAGFLGSHLCEKLLNDDHEVLAVDNFYTGKKENINHLTNDPKFEILRHDITEKLNVEVDFIVNLACPASPVHYQKFPVQTSRTSVLGMLNLLDLANRLEVPILQASTSEVYGDPQVSPQVETYWGNVNPIGLRSCYDEGKRFAETLMFDYMRQYGTKIKVARIFNTYGPRMSFKDGRVVSNFIFQALTGQPITIYGDGNQTRSFCFVSDLIEGITKLIGTEQVFTGPVNLGNPIEMTMNKLAETTIRLCNSSSEITYKDLPQDDPKQRKPEISLAKLELNWEPKIEVEQGLTETINDFKLRMQLPK
jgi:UDP-glucuronate decarboxylase